jgi:subtilisin family serine protease
MQPSKPSNGMDTTMGSARAADTARYIIVTMTQAVHEELVRGERVDREGELPPLYARFIGNLSRAYGLKRVADWPLGSIGIRCLVFEVTDPTRRDATIAALAKEQFVESAQRLSAFSTSGDTAGGSYNDPYRNLQPSLQAMQIAESHRWATGLGVRIAVIDTGLDTKHPELRGRIVGIRNFVDRDDRGFNADVHGTAVAGVIAATSNNGVGFVGVAPQAELLGLKACWQREAQQPASCTSFTLAKALNFAINEQVDIINLSLGGPPDPLLERLVAKALESNILVIGAVNPDWPEGFPTDVADVIAASNQPTASAISAPGTQVLSARPRADYDFFTGSSFSAAHISGLSALIRQRKPHLSARLVKELIVATAQDGPGTANACRAVARIVSDGNCGAGGGTGQAPDN